MSARLGFLLIMLGLFVLVALPLYAYQVALKDGRIIEFQKYRVAGGHLYYVASDGKEATTPLAAIDLERTRQLNAGASPPLALPGLMASDVSSGQAEPSLGDYARKLREKQSKDGKDHSWVSEALGRSDAVKSKTPQGPVQSGSRADPKEYYENLARDMDREADKLENVTARQLADDVVRDVRFPGREYWEANLEQLRREYIQAYRHSAAAHRRAASEGSRQPSTTTILLQEASSELRLADIHFRNLLSEGTQQADEWKRKH